MIDMGRGPDDGRPPPVASRGPVLRVYVADGCGGCRHARQLVTDLLLRCPDADVEVVDLAHTQPELPLPPGLVGTPTYTVDGEVRWLGNPAPQELLDLVGRRRAAR